MDNFVRKISNAEQPQRAADAFDGYRLQWMGTRPSIDSCADGITEQNIGFKILAQVLYPGCDVHQRKSRVSLATRTRFPPEQSEKRKAPGAECGFQKKPEIGKW